MRALALSAALAIASLPAVSFTTAHAAEHARHHRTMTVQLANGKTVKFRLMMMHGTLMAVAPYPLIDGR